MRPAVGIWRDIERTVLPGLAKGSGLAEKLVLGCGGEVFVGSKTARLKLSVEAFQRLGDFFSGVQRGHVASIDEILDVLSDKGFYGRLEKAGIEMMMWEDLTGGRAPYGYTFIVPRGWRKPS